MNKFLLAAIIILIGCTTKNAEKMSLDQLLEKEHMLYMDNYKRGIKEFGTSRSVTEVMLKAESDANRMLPDLYKHNRYDLINIDEQEKFNLVEINMPKDFILNFERQVFDVNGTEVIIEPFVWNSCDFILDKKPNNTFDSWAKKWIDFEDNKEVPKDSFSNVIHNVTYPFEENGQWHISVDFGTAPIEAFKELLTTFNRQGINKIQVRGKAL